MRISPFTAFWNKQYRETGFGKYLQKKLSDLNEEIENLSAKYNKHFLKEAGIYFADDCFIPLRNLGFLDDPMFIRAMGPRSSDKILMGRIWRIWTISWSLSSCWRLEGDVLDLGTYNGKAMYSACKYALLSHKIHIPNRKIFLCDLFENPPAESKKADHDVNLHIKVEKLFSDLFNYSVIVKGSIPNSLNPYNIKKIAWAQIDLNSAEYDLKALQFIYDKLQPDAHVVFDDYGFQRYKKTQDALDYFMRDKSERVFEMPTGQGLLIKS